MTTEPGSSPENGPTWPHSAQPPPQYPGQPQYQPPQYQPPQYEQPQYQPPQYPPQPQYGQPQEPYPPQGTSGWEAQQPAQPGWGEQPPPIWGAPQGMPAGGDFQPAKRRMPVIGKVAIGVGVFTIMACLCGIGAVFLVPSLRSNNASGNPSAFPTASHPSGISATSTAGASSGSNGPFDGTPAAAYPAGVAGITLPKAVKTGVFSATDVSKALTSVQKALIAARLDKQMLVNRNHDPFLKLMALDARADLRKDFTKDTFATYATQIATGSKLAPQTPRVKGRITYRATTNGGIRVIEVITNFVWVYPFVAPSQAPGDDIVVMHDEVTWQFPDVNDVSSTGRGLWIDHAQSYGSNIDCAQFNKGYLAPGTTQTGSGPTEDPNAIYNPEHTIDIKNSC